MYSATLHCGTQLDYEARGFVPARGEAVPCRRHGYCVVERIGMPKPARSRNRGLPRARPKRHDELLEWLEGHEVTTVHALRRERFTLRMIAEAERDGLVAVDLEAGTVAVH